MGKEQTNHKEGKFGEAGASGAKEGIQCTLGNFFFFPTAPSLLLPFLSFSSSAPLLSSSLLPYSQWPRKPPVPSTRTQDLESPPLTSLHPTFLITGLTAKVSRYMSIWR